MDWDDVIHVRLYASPLLANVNPHFILRMFSYKELMSMRKSLNAMGFELVQWTSKAQ